MDTRPTFYCKDARGTKPEGLTRHLSHCLQTAVTFANWWPRLFAIGLDPFARVIGVDPLPIPQHNDDVSPLPLGLPEEPFILDQVGISTLLHRHELMVALDR